MALLTEQAEMMVRAQTYQTKGHHEAGHNFFQKRENNIFLLAQKLERYGNPFENDGENLVNFVTPQVQHDLIKSNFIGK